MIKKVSDLNDEIKEQGVLLKRNDEKLKLRESKIDEMEKNYKKVHGQHEQMIELLKETNELLILERDTTKLDMELYKTKLEEATSRHEKEIEALARRAP